jgi:alpha-glucosidase (family GH31 glycosyl hydrolase)
MLLICYELDEVPVFAKAGAIVPLSDDPVTNSTNNPRTILIEVFRGIQ